MGKKAGRGEETRVVFMFLFLIIFFLRTAVFLEASIPCVCVSTKNKDSGRGGIFSVFQPPFYFFTTLT